MFMSRKLPLVFFCSARPWAATVNPQVTGEALRLQLTPPPKKENWVIIYPFSWPSGVAWNYTHLISSSDPVYSTRPYLGQQLKPEGFFLAALRSLWADSLHEYYNVQVNEAAYEKASEVKQCNLAGVRLLGRNLDHTVIYSPCQAAFSLMRRLGARFFGDRNTTGLFLCLTPEGPLPTLMDIAAKKKKLQSVSLSVCRTTQQVQRFPDQ